MHGRTNGRAGGRAAAAVSGRGRVLSPREVCVAGGWSGRWWVFPLLLPLADAVFASLRERNDVRVALCMQGVLYRCSFYDYDEIRE